MTQLLLDTHALLWWLTEPDRLSPAAHVAINDPANSVHVSAASGWEIATKARIGKLPGIGDLLSDLPELLMPKTLICCPSPIATPTAARKTASMPPAGRRG